MRTLGVAELAMIFPLSSNMTTLQDVLPASIPIRYLITDPYIGIYPHYALPAEPMRSILSRTTCFNAARGFSFAFDTQIASVPDSSSFFFISP